MARTSRNRHPPEIQSASNRYKDHGVRFQRWLVQSAKAHNIPFVASPNPKYDLPIREYLNLSRELIAKRVQPPSTIKTRLNALIKLRTRCWKYYQTVTSWHNRAHFAFIGKMRLVRQICFNIPLEYDTSDSECDGPTMASCLGATTAHHGMDIDEDEIMAGSDQDTAESGDNETETEEGTENEHDSEEEEGEEDENASLSEQDTSSSDRSTPSSLRPQRTHKLGGTRPTKPLPVPGSIRDSEMCLHLPQVASNETCYSNEDTSSDEETGTTDVESGEDEIESEDSEDGEDETQDESEEESERAENDCTHSDQDALSSDAIMVALLSQKLNEPKLRKIISSAVYRPKSLVFVGSSMLLSASRTSAEDESCASSHEDTSSDEEEDESCAGSDKDTDSDDEGSTDSEQPVGVNHSYSYLSCDTISRPNVDRISGQSLSDKNKRHADSDEDSGSVEEEDENGDSLDEATGSDGEDSTAESDQ
ncbi:hypothetical protein MVEN_00226700 [Mycena venus]|uniref:DUF6604 domain-containing protein n=1 Tax=Mycena venus TaxID=2733690 RepID=A0A8H6YXP9_9AGAR|nr:hypothetical protein MVEN_00226700 [Mycena venus]